MTSSKKILIVGLGFGQLYKDLLESKGHIVHTLDINESLNPTYTAISQISERYFLSIISCPNYLHDLYAMILVDKSEHVLVEKPGFKDLETHMMLMNMHPGKIHMTKNNYFRESFQYLKDRKDLTKIDLCWVEKNRIPHPGSWFTTKSKAFGGVSRDLLPHMFHVLKLISKEKFIASSWSLDQYYNLTELQDTDYGSINKDGIFDVDDNCTIYGKIGNIYACLDVGWKDPMGEMRMVGGFDTNGNIVKIPFDLCPVEAYDTMLDKLFFNPDEKVRKLSQEIDIELMELYETISKKSDNTLL